MLFPKSSLRYALEQKRFLPQTQLPSPLSYLPCTSKELGETKADKSLANPTQRVLAQTSSEPE